MLQLEDMESHEERLRRFQDGPPLEIIETLLNSIANFSNREIRDAANLAAPAWNLVLLGIHSVALTIVFALFDQSGPAGYRMFLERFVDTGGPADFSAIADEIHGWRNVIAHQWLSKQGHTLALDTTIATGWERRGEVLHFNPRIYTDAYLSAFGARGRIWDWNQMLTPDQQRAAKGRMITNYVEH
jgi:hypothetical protein